MASADTLCKKILNVKNTVVESHEFYIDTLLFTGTQKHLWKVLKINFVIIARAEQAKIGGG